MFRRDELRTAELKLDGPEAQRYKLAASVTGLQCARHASAGWQADRNPGRYQSTAPGGGLFYCCNNPSPLSGFFPSR
ncbi:MAG: hypothetical protein CPDRYMAC_6709 [uncultured Paraburkholderia sp.]|nr:MAG: hypothetical protein CPDRYDRY_6668 [uncultured Paraburkholderia sp.]CAH2945076.1 MAG: hypothetical protein CPDRYMAC_6709 [uncultured Paraburkholderia sp.]